jgi:hypothetical protein
VEFPGGAGEVGDLHPEPLVVDVFIGGHLNESFAADRGRATVSRSTENVAFAGRPDPRYVSLVALIRSFASSMRAAVSSAIHSAFSHASSSVSAMIGRSERL